MTRIPRASLVRDGHAVSGPVAAAALVRRVAAGAAIWTLGLGSPTLGAQTPGAQTPPPAQTQGSEPARSSAPFQLFDAPDGSRFILAPDPVWFRPPIVHWVTLVPTDLADDPNGAEGLGRAIVRASLDGSAATGSLDPGRESDALDALDALERKALASGARSGTASEAELRVARATASALGLPDPWRRELARAGAADLELRELDGASLIHVAVPTDGLREVALLIRERRENPLLRDLRHHFEAVRDELRTASDSASGRMQRDILGSAFPGAATARPIAATSRIWSRAEALAVFAAIHHPSRSLHVLSGSFEPSRVLDLLRTAFANSALPPVAPPPPPSPAEAQARRSELPGGPDQAVAIAWPAPAGQSAEKKESARFVKHPTEA